MSQNNEQSKVGNLNEEILKNIQEKVFKDNPQLKEMMDQTKSHIQNLVNQNEAMKQETASARRIIWAMINVQGGRIAIPDRIMQIAGDEKNVLKTHYDSSTKETVFLAQTQESRIIKP